MIFRIISPRDDSSDVTQLLCIANVVLARLGLATTCQLSSAAAAASRSVVPRSAPAAAVPGAMLIAASSEPAMLIAAS